MKVSNSMTFSAAAVGRSIMGVLAVSAVGAALGSVDVVRSADEAHLWVQVWRGTAFIAFAGLFALIAWRPTRAAGLWEIVFGHKAAMALVALNLSGVPEALTAGTIDAALAGLTLAAWFLSKGWTSWAGARNARVGGDGQPSQAS